MIEVSLTEMFLFAWGIGATAFALEYRKTANERGRMLMGAAMFVKRVVQDDSLREELRVVISKDKEAEFKFGVGE
jgi:hypothetical protein